MELKTEAMFGLAVIYVFARAKGGLEGLQKIINTSDQGKVISLDFKRFPTKIRKGNRLFIACKGYIRGFFEIVNIEIGPYIKDIDPDPYRRCNYRTGRVYLINWKTLEHPLKYERPGGFQYVNPIFLLKEESE